MSIVGTKTLSSSYIPEEMFNYYRRLSVPRNLHIISGDKVVVLRKLQQRVHGIGYVVKLQRIRHDEVPYLSKKSVSLYNPNGETMLFRTI